MRKLLLLSLLLCGCTPYADHGEIYELNHIEATWHLESMPMGDSTIYYPVNDPEEFHINYRLWDTKLRAYRYGSVEVDEKIFKSYRYGDKYPRVEEED